MILVSSSNFNLLVLTLHKHKVTSCNQTIKLFQKIILIIGKCVIRQDPVGLMVPYSLFLSIAPLANDFSVYVVISYVPRPIPSELSCSFSSLFRSVCAFSMFCPIFELHLINVSFLFSSSKSKVRWPFSLPSLNYTTYMSPFGKVNIPWWPSALPFFHSPMYFIPTGCDAIPKPSGFPSFSSPLYFCWKSSSPNLFHTLPEEKLQMYKILIYLVSQETRRRENSRVVIIRICFIKLPKIWS